MSKILNFLEVMQMPTGTEFIEVSTRDYYRIDNDHNLEDAERIDITFKYISRNLSQTKFQVI